MNNKFCRQKIKIKLSLRSSRLKVTAQKRTRRERDTREGRGSSFSPRVFPSLAPFFFAPITSNRLLRARDRLNYHRITKERWEIIWYNRREKRRQLKQTALFMVFRILLWSPQLNRACLVEWHLLDNFTHLCVVSPNFLWHRFCDLVPNHFSFAV